MDVEETIALYLAAPWHDAASIRRIRDREGDPGAFGRGLEAEIEWRRQTAIRHQLAQHIPSVVLSTLRTATRLMRQRSGDSEHPVGATVAIFNNASDLVVECGDEGAESLLEALKDPEASVQALATMCLGSLVGAPSPGMTEAVGSLLGDAIEREDHPTIGAAAAAIVFWESSLSDGPVEAARFLLADFALRSLGSNPLLRPIHARWVRETSVSYANATLFLRRFPLLLGTGT